MKTRFPICPFLFFILLLVSIGCGPTTPSDQVAATEKVLREVGAAKPTDTPTARSPESLGPSIVKQSGESPSAGTSSHPSPKPPSRQKISTDDPSSRWMSADKLPRELWEVQYLGNAQVGFSHKTTVVAEALGSNHFRHELDSRIRVSIKNAPLEQRIRIMTIERDNGELITMEGSIEMGPNKQSFRGTVSQEVLRLTGEENGQRFDVQLEWKKDYRGPFAVEQSMLRRPMLPGELRRLKYIDPVRRKLVDGVLDAKEYLPTPTMLGGSQELLEVRSIGLMGEQGFQSLLWVDKKGEGLKSFVQENDILSFRTEPITGQIFEACINLRSLPAVSIPTRGDIEGNLEHPGEIASVTYRFRHKTEDVYRMFLDKIGQSIKPVEPKTVDVTVFRKNAGPGNAATNPAASTPAYLANSVFIPKDMVSIQKIGRGVMTSDKSLSDESTNSDKAKACLREIQKRVALKDYDIQIRSLPLVAKSRIGNCVENATLLAAVCRSIGIPTRIAFGVKWNGSKETPAMKFHTWAEILDGQSWVPMDSSQDEGQALMDRVKFRDSDFNSANPYLEILEIYRLLPGLDIEVRPPAIPQSN